MGMNFKLGLIISVELLLLSLPSEAFLGANKIAVVNHEQNFNNKTYQECNWKNKCSFKNLSCRYLDSLNFTRKEYYRTPEEAQAAVKTGNAWGVLYFTNNFSDALVARIALKEDSDEYTLDQSKVRVWLEASIPGQNYGKTNLQNSFRDATNTLFEACFEKPTDIGSLFLFQKLIVPKKLAIFNNEAHYINRTYQECPWIKGCKFTNLGCRYLAGIKDEMKEYYPSLEEAKTAVKTDSAWGALYVSENFTDAFAGRIALQDGADKETLDQSVIKIWLYNSNNQTGGITQQELQQLVQNTTRELFNDCYELYNTTLIPVSFQKFHTSEQTHNSVNSGVN